MSDFTIDLQQIENEETTNYYTSDTVINMLAMAFNSTN